uniref:Chloride intracellular channel 4 n=1 Tax=Schistosoma japonicum TaxID=6182 RepID=C1LNR5_SCHJA|nr:chloride intracellular channel 4 [Schistosoma japonicum]
MVDVNKPLIEFFLKAAPSDRKERGACLISQQWFMTLYCLVEKGLINLRVTPMTMDVPPANYVKLNAARHLPIAWIESGILDGEDASGLVISSTESLETLLIKLKCANLNPNLAESDVRAAEKNFEDLYSSLMQYIKNDTKKPLCSVLSNLNAYLASAAKPYAMGDEISYVDCQLAPKLQHVRVAGRAYKNFDIPHDMKHIWTYIQNIYKLKSFISFCPTTRDILMHYDEKNPLPKEIRPSLMGPDILLDIPQDVLSSQNGNHY